MQFRIGIVRSVVGFVLGNGKTTVTFLLEMVRTL